MDGWMNEWGDEQRTREVCFSSDEFAGEILSDVYQEKSGPKTDGAY